MELTSFKGIYCYICFKINQTGESNIYDISIMNENNEEYTHETERHMQHIGPI